MENFVYLQSESFLGGAGLVGLDILGALVALDILVVLGVLVALVDLDIIVVLGVLDIFR